MLVFLLKGYKKYLSPVLVSLFGHSCRYTPTCSEYMVVALQKFGILKGAFLGIKRFLKCNPFFEGGWDPI